MDQAQTIVELNRKNMAEQHSYEEIPDTETSIKMVYFGYTDLDLTPSYSTTPNIDKDWKQVVLLQSQAQKN